MNSKLKVAKVSVYIFFALFIALIAVDSQSRVRGFGMSFLGWCATVALLSGLISLVAAIIETHGSKKY